MSPVSKPSFPNPGALGLSIFLPNCFAKASCAAAIRTARDFVADVGAEAAARSGGINELAARNPKNGERDCERLMANRYGLSIPVEQEFLPTKTLSPGLRIPFIRFRNWMNFLLAHNCMHILTGLVRPDHAREGEIWLSFWTHFEQQCPGHPIFARAKAGLVDLRRCVALLLHGDEGRSKKRQPFLVLNLHSPLGRGTEPGIKAAAKRKYIKMLPNFRDRSYTNRFMIAALAKGSYTGDNAPVFVSFCWKLFVKNLHM